MRVLELTNPILTGNDVTAWQRFISGKGFWLGRIDGDFGNKTHQATIAFQRRYRLYPDGVVGRRTLRVAREQGFVPPNTTAPTPPPPRQPNPARPPRPMPTGGVVPPGSTTYPPRPSGLPAPTLQNAINLFGSFAYRPNPATFNGRGITITDGWDNRNIVTVNIPQLRGIPIYGTPGRGNMRVHRLVSGQIARLFRAWEDAGLINLVRTFSGGFTPRFIGGTRTLSNHAFGAAFDINEEWNGQPATPAATGRTGSVRELVPIANSLGFYWGGHYTGRKDGMHFEVVVIQ